MSAPGSLKSTPPKSNATKLKSTPTTAAPTPDSRSSAQDGDMVGDGVPQSAACGTGSGISITKNAPIKNANGTTDQSSISTHTKGTGGNGPVEGLKALQKPATMQTELVEDFQNIAVKRYGDPSVATFHSLADHAVDTKLVKSMQGANSQAQNDKLSQHGQACGTTIFKILPQSPQKDVSVARAHGKLAQIVQNKMTKLHRKANHLVRFPAQQKVDGALDDIFALMTEIKTLTTQEQQPVVGGPKLTLDERTHNHFQRECFTAVVKIMNGMPTLPSSNVHKLIANKQHFVDTPQAFSELVRGYIDILTTTGRSQAFVNAASNNALSANATIGAKNITRDARRTLTKQTLFNAYGDAGIKTSLESKASTGASGEGGSN